MLRRIGNRLASGLLTLVLVTGIVFVLIQISPGGPLGPLTEDEGFKPIGAEARQELARQYHLDRPWPVQYAMWVGDLLTGDLGRSFLDRRPVAEKILRRLPLTLTLNLLSLALMIAVAVPLGALAAARPGTRIDRWTAGSTYLLYAVPVFWAGLLLQILFSVHLDWLPLAGIASEGAAGHGPVVRALDRAAHLVLPVLCLSYGGIAYLSRFVRATLLDQAAADNVLAARARGLSSTAVIVRHGFRQAAIPLLTLAGFLLPSLVSGSVIVETIFALPGLGRLFVDAAFGRDLPVLLALTLISGTATLIGIVLADLAYAWADPRIRRG